MKKQKRLSAAWCMGGVLLLVVLGGCESSPKKPNATQLRIEEEMRKATASREAAVVPPSVSQALLQAQPVASERIESKPAEKRFNLAVSNAPAAQVFAAMGSDSRYSVVVHPEVTGSLTLNLKDVTFTEALDTIREVYGFDYRVQGNRVLVQPASLQTRFFQVNYLAGTRVGRSDTRVISGSIVTNGNQNNSSGNSSSGSSQNNSSGNNSSGSSSVSSEGAMVQTQNKTDFWAELSTAVNAVVGSGNGRSVVISPQTGVLIVRAMPRELREVENYIRLSQISLEREVMLEAKIVEVVLNDGYQNGINWTAMVGGRNSRIGSGVNNSQVVFPTGYSHQGGAVGSVWDKDSGTWVNSSLSDVLAAPVVGGIDRLIQASPLANSMGLTFASGNFNAVLSFLSTQGTTHVMSSPRIATLNNQKAVLKVGSDDYYVTNITNTTTSSASGSTSSPTINLQAFFSGISLDVTPQIDDQDNVIMHIRPSVSVVSERNKQINLGSSGVFNLPLASSRTNETDSIVRIREGNIVAIGGLMEQAQANDSAKVPGLGDVPVAGQLFKQGREATQKRELVVLLKATIIRGDKQWEQDLVDTAARFSGMGAK